ncbi:MAG: NAD(P) transhydrogenase subunit alpha [Devosia sp.]|jgi:NAD(P) transhydrogenase subunit alpha|uniref:NAD(P) transhydrogenase subunit alpha n=1 Tax=unclassified Devosia TaxID=196773 RepID=UPI0019FEF443|nr:MULTISPECIES: NAD(P) transhydrogenase subunit alpha [unclassified Devosia]MBF0680602.1 NAD(P) transhydrogenase subunit alpha [Devosia sp.]WEJ34466.1 NAD(P) transhydrogenase subunit alpha [Devosia sp. SD17-2]
MPETTVIQLFVFLLASFVGLMTIHRVPPLLHTPLMAATNAMSGISLVASLVLAGANHGWLGTIFGTIAVAMAMANVVGGFLITDRMLAMFKSDNKKADKAAK